MNLQIDWLINAWESIEEPSLQDRLIACGFLAAELEDALQENLG